MDIDLTTPNSDKHAEDVEKCFGNLIGGIQRMHPQVRDEVLKRLNEHAKKNGWLKYKPPTNDELNEINRNFNRERYGIAE
jgi:hypothetical protein